MVVKPSEESEGIFVMPLSNILTESFLTIMIIYQKKRLFKRELEDA